MKKPFALVIMDGFGINPSAYGNAIKKANKPNLDKYWATCPHTTIGASGLDVGLPDGQMGNSEVGHTNIGAGRIVYQSLTRITKSIKDGDFFQNAALTGAMENCKKNHSALHLMGLLSSGGVHSHNTHLYALLKMAKQFGIGKVWVHCFMDGRDEPPMSGKSFIEELQKEIAAIGVGKIATVEGRYYAMDRDNRWNRVVKAYDAIACGEGVKNADPVSVMENSYKEKVTDEFVVPAVCAENAAVCANDSVIFYNFRPDRARELTRAFVDPEFSGFERKKGYFPLYYVCMTQYDASMPNVHVAFGPESLANTLGEYLSDKGLTQLRIAETEKYAHVTFFFNGGVEKPFAGEDRVLVPSPKVATYDLKPDMSADEVTGKAVEKIESGKYDVIILNYANCDMVGHTGVFDAAVKAVETVDRDLSRLVDAVTKMNGSMIVIADHGNADHMLEPDGTPFTAHSTNPVPFIVINHPCKLREGGRLCDVAPSLLKIMNLEQPREMTGKSIILD